jgi:wyosine [tRNA(Phe)-imidazoG37] synthetase (radical SAM superfamily)
MNAGQQEEADKTRLFNDLDEIKKQLTAVETKVTVMYKSFSGNGQPPLENRITKLETELKQIKDSAAKSWQVMLAIGMAGLSFVGSAALTFMKQ